MFSRIWNAGTDVLAEQKNALFSVDLRALPFRSGRKTKKL